MDIMPAFEAVFGGSSPSGCTRYLRIEGIFHNFFLVVTRKSRVLSSRPSLLTGYPAPLFDSLCKACLTLPAQKTQVFFVRVPGIEPESRPWQGRVLPLNHTRITDTLLSYTKAIKNKRVIKNKDKIKILAKLWISLGTCALKTGL